MQCDKKLRLQTSFISNGLLKYEKKIGAYVLLEQTTIFMIIYFFTSTGQLEIYLDA